MSVKVVHMAYLPIADRYDVHDIADCTGEFVRCRRVTTSTEILSLMRETQELAKAAYELASEMYRSGQP